MVCFLLDVCGLWLCLPPISVFGVIRMPTGPTVNAPYQSATPEATAAAEKPLRGWKMDELCTRRQVNEILHLACHLVYRECIYRSSTCMMILFHDAV